MGHLGTHLKIPYSRIARYPPPVTLYKSTWNRDKLVEEMDNEDLNEIGDNTKGKGEVTEEEDIDVGVEEEGEELKEEVRDPCVKRETRGL